MVQWRADPSVYMGLIALLAGYAWLARDAADAARSHAVYFIVGLLWIWVALETPLDGLGDQYLQSAHMAQHMILMAFAPPFVLLGLTPTMARRLLRIPGLAAVTAPVPALLCYTAAIIFWHIPPVFDFAIQHDAVHLLEHLSFLAGGVIFWWPMIQATSSVSGWPLSEPQKLVLLFFGMLPMMAVALPLQFAGYVLYRPYAEAPRVNGFLTPVVDQTVAGATMMFMDTVTMAVAGLALFFRWISREHQLDRERASRAIEEEDDAEEAAALDAFLDPQQRHSGRR